MLLVMKDIEPDVLTRFSVSCEKCKVELLRDEIILAPKKLYSYICPNCGNKETSNEEFPQVRRMYEWSSVRIS